MPPKAMKTIAYRRKLPIRRQEAKPSPSPSPPAKKHGAATTTDAQARKLQCEAPSTFASRRVEVTEIALSSSSSSSESSDTSDSSSPMNETNVYEKVDELIERNQTHEDAHRGQIHGDTLPQGVHIFRGDQDNDEEEEEERGQVQVHTAPEQEQMNAQEEGQNTA